MVRISLLITFLALIPFILLFMRDFVYANSEVEEMKGCVPYDLTTEKDRFSATVHWKTTEECAGYIEFDLTSKSNEGKRVNSTDGILPVNDHTVIIEDLKPETRYYLWIYSNGQPYGDNGTPVEIKL